ncbi:MAG: pyridoxal-dependent decarboxylase, exosortase A system-associated [Steroidobacteraceae bacterium]
MSVDAFVQHAPHPYYEVHDDCLTIDGRSLLEVAAQAGGTPFYVYSREYMTTRVRELRSTLPEGIHLHYAVKANPMPAVVSHMAGLVDGLDAASAREVQLGLDAGAHARCISFAGPGKTILELEQAAAAGIVVNVESEREIKILADVGRRSTSKPRIAIRVNPDFELRTSGMKMGGGPKQFGIDSERVPEILAGLAGLPLEFVGFHIFSGSQNLRADSIVEAQQKAVDLAIRLARRAPAQVRLLNIGGGFGIPYFPGDQPLETAPIAANLKRLLPAVRQHLPDAHLVIELGRYLVGECGLYVCKVIDRKVSRGHTFLVTDGGLHHHLAASGNFGQVIRKNYPVLIGNRVRGSQREIASVVGPLCTPLDLLADRMDLAVAVEGDLVAIFQSGAYGLTASPLRFLGHPEPIELVV